MASNRFIFLFTICYSIIGKSYSQEEKRPQIQQSSIWMKNFEADGEWDEWQQPLQAYNDDTHIAYSLANDDMYLYLAVKSNRWMKILAGGLMLEVINMKGKSPSVIFPYNTAYDRRGGQFKDQLNDIGDITELEVSGIAAIAEKTSRY